MFTPLTDLSKPIPIFNVAGKVSTLGTRTNQASIFQLGNVEVIIDPATAEFYPKGLGCGVVTNRKEI